MTPTPNQHSSFPSAPSHSNLRLARLRRPRNANPYDAAHQQQRSTPVTTPTPATPVIDDSDESESEEGEEAVGPEDFDDPVSEVDDMEMFGGDPGGTRTSTSRRQEERGEEGEEGREEGTGRGGEEHYLAEGHEGHEEEGGIEEGE